MDLLIGAVGRATKGPERALLERYLARAAALGRQVGVGRVDAFEVSESPAPDAPRRRADEAARLLARLPRDAVVVALAATGRPLASEALSEALAAWQERGAPSAVFLVGGPDGHGPAVTDRARLVWSLGAHTMPHLLARVVVAEQVYRAITILAHHPYHRG